MKFGEFCEFREFLEIERLPDAKHLRTSQAKVGAWVSREFDLGEFEARTVSGLVLMNDSIFIPNMGR